MHSVKQLVVNANHYLAIQKGKEVSTHIYVPDDKLSKTLNGLWGQFHGFSQKANAIIIHQNLVLAACHIRCFVDVCRICLSAVIF